MRTTWDGLPISPEPPYGCAIVVFRRAGNGREVLMLHRAHHGSEYEGDWAWTPPSGSRLPGEAPEECARRELREETGLALALHATDCGTPEWLAYWAEAPQDAVVTLDAEHDRFAWLPAEEALRRCAPDAPRLALARVLALLDAGSGGPPGT
jgi:8-oxo-dGTP pyrophosphatase MutT (NUDIX family)